MRKYEDAAMARAFFKRRVVEDDNNIGGSFEECKFISADDSGVYFTRPMLDDSSTRWGPAPWTWPALGVTGAASAGTAHTHSVPVPTNGPQAGDRLLVVFVTVPNGGLRPWVIGWSAT